MFRCTIPVAFDILRGRKGSLCIVVSPLIALMKDQVRVYKERGVSTAYIGSEQQDRTVYEEIRSGKVQLIYMTPEAIADNEHHRSLLQEQAVLENLVAFVVDEAHCIQTWLGPLALYSVEAYSNVTTYWNECPFLGMTVRR